MDVIARTRQALLPAAVVALSLLALLVGIERYASTDGLQPLQSTYEYEYEGAVVGPAAESRGQPAAESTGQPAGAVPAQAVPGQPAFTG